jgi:hypothetical protein
MNTHYKQATLPEDLEGATVDSMMTGQAAYMVPWGMWVDRDRHCWLHPKYTISSHLGGTFEMRIELREDGYHVWPPQGETWSTQQEPGFVSPTDTEYIPVVELHR